VLDRGIRHVYIKPATPRLNGKVCDDCGDAAPGRSDSGQSVTLVSFVRCVDRFRCCVTMRTGQTKQFLRAVLRRSPNDVHLWVERLEPSGSKSSIDGRRRDSKFSKLRPRQQTVLIGGKFSDASFEIRWALGTKARAAWEPPCVPVNPGVGGRA